MKVTKEEREKLKEVYLGYRKQGYGQEQARLLTSRDTGRGRTTVYDNTVGTDFAFGKLPPEGDYVETSWPKSYIITGFELRVKPDKKFIECLKQMAGYYDAEMLLVPLQKGDTRYLPDVLKDNFKIVTNDIKFNSNLQLKYVETTALVQSPLAGHTGAYPKLSTILPGLIKELKSENSQYYIKQLMSTGSVGYLDAAVDYPEFEEDKDFVKRQRTMTSRSAGRPTAIAENYIVPSALIVDVLDENTFLTRYVSSHRNGVVYDLNKKFTVEGYEDSRPLALVTGDSHLYSVDEQAYEATKEMIKFLNPKEVVVNDAFDGASVNHHGVADAVEFSKAPSIREEADVTMGYLEELCSISEKVIYQHSNHDDFIIKYLNFGDRMWKVNRNYEVCCGLQLFRAKTGLHPIIKLLEFNKLKNLKFVSTKENHFIGKVLSKHGHESFRGGFPSLAKMHNFYVQGHLHSPAVYRNAVMVGLIARMDQGYNDPSSSGWGFANAAVQPDSSMQLLNIIRGEWIK